MYPAIAAFILNLIIICTNAKAQEIADTALPGSFTVVAIHDSIASRTKSHFQLGASYVNDNVYLGRKDSVAIPYFTPAMGYYTKSGFYAIASFGFLASSTGSRLDMASFAMGYSFTAGNYDGEVTASKFFYSSQSTSVKSELKETLEYLNGYDLGFLRPTLLATINIGNKVDIMVTPGLEHSFTWKDKWEITPTFLTTDGTQNYYNDYYKKRKYSPKRKNKLPPNGVQSISGFVLDAGVFKVLDYECSLPITYTFRKCTFSFTPVYAIPVHPAEVIITTKLNNGTSTTVTGFEKLQNTFFGTIEFICKF